jgi:DNA mismatch endonuclease (patch repair protein)
MSLIKSKNTKPEKKIKELLRSLGFVRYKTHGKGIPGTPDIFLKKEKKCLFVNGCFWHGHKGCKRAKLPTTNQIFWKEKIRQNILHDRKVYRELAELGWRHLTIWQCQIKDGKEILLKNRIHSFLIKGTACK